MTPSGIQSIFSLWGFFNKKMSGVTLPSNRPDQTVEESEDEGIKVLVESCLKNLKFDGYPVTNVHVPSKSSIVKICQEDHKNDFIPQEETLII